MIDLPAPRGRTLERARETFVEMAAVEAVLRPEHKGRIRLSASALYAAAKSGEGNAGLEAELAENPYARKFHASVIAQWAPFALGSLRAASSGASSERHGDGCHIRIEQSRAEPNQFFVVVHLLREPAGQAPTSLIVCDDEDHCRRFPLPALRNGVAQFIAEADSEIMQLMDDPKTRVYLG